MIINPAPHAVRQTLLFHVPIDAEPSKATRWLRADGTVTFDTSAGVVPDDAVFFVHHASPTIRELAAIERREHEEAGGLTEWIDLRTGMENARAAVIRELEAKLWPPTKAGRHTSRPEAEGKAYDHQQDALDEAWRGHTSTAMRGLGVLTNRMDRMTFVAEWAVLVVDPPTGWEDLGAREWPEYGHFVAVWTAWLQARKQVHQGK